MTTVNIQVIDLSGQVWRNGSIYAQLQTSFGQLLNVPAVQAALDTNGSASLTLTPNISINPAGSQWLVTVCPSATASCFSQPVTVSGVTQQVAISPPAITIQLNTAQAASLPIRATAYSSSEIIGAQVGSVYYDLTQKQLMLLTAGPNTWTPVSVTGSISISPINFGAKWDGVADDTAAIQAAINAAYSVGGYVQFPPGTSHISTTLNILSSVKIKGTAHMGPDGSYLLYSGTGTALQIGHPTGLPEVFAVILEDFGIQSTGAADKGIASYNLSEAMFNHMSIGGTPTSYFNTAIYLSQTGDLEIAHPVVSYNNVGVWCDSYNNSPFLPNYQIRIHDGSFYANSEATFKLNSVDGAFIAYNFIESCQYGVELNDSGNNGNISTTPQLVSCEHVVIESNRFLLDDAPSGTYSVRYPLYVNGTSGKLLTIIHSIFSNNDVFIANSLSPSVAYPFQFLLNSGTNSGSLAWIDLIRNTVHGQTAGLFESNNAKIQVSILDNRLISLNGVEQTNETDSSTGLLSSSVKLRNGTFCVGNNNFLTGATAAIQDNTISIGATNLLIKAGPGQSSTPLLSVEDNLGNILLSSLFNTASTVGSAGGASALPATPSGYLVVNISGTNFKLPYYAN